jgi:glycosyltransferase involved in cell wall biosynthesis
MSPPAVSVVMPVHNNAPYLHESVRSILGQTFDDFELVAVENGSSDESRSILRGYAAADDRIRLFECPRALGLAGSANYLVSKSTAPLVANMDADDISHPDRLRRQLEVMRREADVVVVGSLEYGIDSESRRVRPRDRWRLMRCSEIPFTHGSSMFRRDALQGVGGYREGMTSGREMDLFLRLADRGRIVVLPDALYLYRYHLASTTATFPLREMTRSKELGHRFLAETRAGRDREQVLERPTAESRPDSIAAALYYHGAYRLWAGQPPGILGELGRSGAATFSLTWLRTLVWAVWARVSPATLRLFVRCLIRARDLVAGARLRDGRPHEWRVS